MAKKAKRNIADKAMKRIIAEALKSRKLVRQILKTIERDPKLRVQFISVVGEQLAHKAVAETELKYYGPPNDQFPSGGRTRYEYFLSHGATKRIASALNFAQVTPYQLFLMSDKEILERKGLGPATVDYAKELREELSQPSGKPPQASLPTAPEFPEVPAAFAPGLTLSNQSEYIGPKDSEFENAHALMNYWLEEGFVPEMAGRLTDNRWTPHKIFLLDDLDSIRSKLRRVGDVTIAKLQINKARNTKADKPKPTAQNVADLEP